MVLDVDCTSRQGRYGADQRSQGSDQMDRFNTAEIDVPPRFVVIIGALPVVPMDRREPAWTAGGAPDAGVVDVDSGGIRVHRSARLGRYEAWVLGSGRMESQRSTVVASSVRRCLMFARTWMSVKS